MEAKVEEIIAIVKKIKEYADQLFNVLEEQELSHSIVLQGEYLNERLNAFFTMLEKNSATLDLFEKARQVSTHGEALARELLTVKNEGTIENKLSLEIKNLCIKLGKRAEIKTKIFSTKEDRKTTIHGNEYTENLIEIEKKIDGLNNTFIANFNKAKKTHDRLFENLNIYNKKKFDDLIEDNIDLEKNTNIEINKLRGYYELLFNELKLKNKKADDVLSELAGDRISFEYLKSAKIEDRSAFWFRVSSIITMFIIIVVVGSSFWGISLADFKWENSISRIILAFFLSIPATYFARESSKHREQYYNYKQAYLDLITLEPYIGNMPKEEQIKIKTSLADRMFANRDFSNVSKDPFPLNTQESILKMMEFLQKIEGKKVVSKSENEPNKDKTTT